MYTHTATHAVKHKPRPRGRVVHFSLIFFWVFSVFLLHVHKHTVEGRGRVVGGEARKEDGLNVGAFCGGQMALESSSSRSRDNNVVSFAVDRRRWDRQAAATTT